MLYNRGIKVEDQQDWLNAGWDDIYPWYELNDDSKMELAVNMVDDCWQNDRDICVVVDSDQDGYTSAAMFINYLTLLDKDYVKQHISWVHHTGKAHGLGDTVYQILEENPALVVIPDGGSNDEEQQDLLQENGTGILVLDHHECIADYSDLRTYRDIINVQISKYPNKSLTGAGVVWQFCRAFDELNNYDFADNFIDLAAFGDCADMADYRQPEIRALINLGFSNIKNPFFYALSKKNEYTYEKHHKGYLGMAFAVAPFVNAICRSGTMGEKEEVFKAMLTAYAFEKVESSKRGEKGIFVPRYQNAVTIVEQVKRRQTQLQDIAMENIVSKIEDNHLTDNAIIAVVVDPDECEASLAGLCANKIQAQYQHPAMVLRRTKTKEDTEEKYVGSLRNYSNCSISNMASLCRSTGIPDFVAGHESAAGVGISSSKFSEFIAATNELYKGIDFTPVYWVDYIWDENTIDPQAILELGGLELYGQEIPESQVVVENIRLSETNVTLMGAKRNTIKVMCGSVACILFGTDEDTYQKFIEGDKQLTIVGVPNCNEWNGNVLPQILIDDYELTEAEEEWIF